MSWCLPTGLHQCHTGSTSGHGVSLLGGCCAWGLQGQLPAAPPAPAGAWPLTCPFILCCWCVNEGRTPGCSQQSALHSAFRPLQRAGGLCNLCWQPRALCVCSGGALPPSPELPLCRIQVGRSHLGRAAGSISPCKVTAGDASFPWGAPGSCCTPESMVGGLNCSSTGKGRALGLAGARRGAAAVAGFTLVPPPWSCLGLLLHLLKSSRVFLKLIF